MKKLYELKDSLCEKLEEYSGKEVTTSTLEIMEALSTTIKNLCKIISMSEEEYSNMNHSRNSYYGGSYNDGSYEGSFARGRNARRDSMGRYSRDEGLVEEMRNLANSLPSNQRGDMERLIHKMENM